MPEALLTILANEQIGRALGIIGAVIAALCAAGWAIFKHLRSSSPSKNEGFLSITQYQDLLRAEQVRIGEEALNGKIETNELWRRQDELTRKLADIERAYSDALKQNEELNSRISELSTFTDRSDFEAASEALRLRKFDDARAYFAKCLERLNPILKDAAASHLGMAIASEERGDWPAAAESYTSALALNEDEYTLGQTSKFLWLAGNPTAAIHLSKKLLDLAVKRTGRASVSTASALNLLAGQLYEIGEYKEARSHLAECLSVLEQLNEEKSYRYASSLANLANIHLVEGDYSTAEKLLRRALPILEGEDAELALAARNSLAEVLRLQGNSEASLALMEENLSKTSEAVGRMHPHTARALNFLGKAQLQSNRTEPALRSLLDAFEIQKSCLGEFHHNTISIAANVIHVIDENAALCSEELMGRMAMYRKILEDMKQQASPSSEDDS